MIVALFSLVLIVVFQNCGNVKVEQPSIPAPQQFFSVSGSFCPSNSGAQTFLLQEFYIVNLTTKVSRFSGRFLADSDMDGLPDIEETEDFSLNPTSRRTNGILDAVCLDAGLVGCTPSGAGNFVSFGLKDVDVENQYLSGAYAQDQDQDKIPDFLEILFGTLVGTQDGDVSSDSPGGETSIEQIKKGKAPKSTLDNTLPEAQQTSYQTQYSTQVACPNSTNGYQFSLDQMPLLPTLAFSSTDESYLNHAENENLILFMVVSVTNGGAQKISYVLKKISYDNPLVTITLAPTDFVTIDTPL